MKHLVLVAQDDIYVLLARQRELHSTAEDLAMRACRIYALVLLLAGCGRTELGLPFGEPDAASGSMSLADAAIDSVVHSADVRACQWAGFAPQVTYPGSGQSIAVGP